jgi:hypothetical protein
MVMLDGDVRYVFEYAELEKVVKEVYGKDIRILDERYIPFELIGHYTYHEWTVNGEDELIDICDDDIVRKWIETGEMDNLDMSDIPEYDWKDTADVGLEHIMHRLFIEGHIPAGKYVMLVDW